MYEQLRQDCHLFSEHVEFGSGTLVEEDNKYLVVARLDKDSDADTRRTNPTLKTEKHSDKTETIILPSSYQKPAHRCDHCEL